MDVASHSNNECQHFPLLLIGNLHVCCRVQGPHEWKNNIVKWNGQLLWIWCVPDSDEITKKNGSLASGTIEEVNMHRKRYD